MTDTRVFSHRGRGHDHYWCSEDCAKSCQFGPCCEVAEESPPLMVVSTHE